MHKQPPYSNHGPIDMVNEEERIYAGPSTDGLIQTNAGKHLMLNLTNYQLGDTLGPSISGLTLLNRGSKILANLFLPSLSSFEEPNPSACSFVT